MNKAFPVFLCLSSILFFVSVVMTFVDGVATSEAWNVTLFVTSFINAGAPWVLSFRRKEE